MDFKEEYKSKLVSADKAVSVIKSGDWVDFGWCTNTPEACDKALAKRTDELFDVNLRGGILYHTPAIFEREDAGEHFTWNSWHMTGVERKMISRGCAFYAPVKYSELPRYYRENIRHLNVEILQVSPMDNGGYFNFGVSASHLAAAIECADVVIVEVNKNMPRCLGGYETEVHISDVDYVVEGDNPPLCTLPASGEATEVDRKVASLIVNEIPDGACLQLGIGGMPNAVGKMIAESDLKDLGVHTEMYVDAFVELTEAGKITGKRKALDRGRQVYAFASGSQKMYDFLNDNPACMAAPVDYTNAAATVSQIDNFISINNAVNVDLFGQVNAESAGTKHISGAGGQLDFVIGAYLSKGGKSFICLSSTFTGKDGSLQSRILPTLSQGSIVTDTRANTMYVVTEYGIRNLKGLSTWQRAEALIELSHPDFRDSLIKDAEKMGIWRRSNRQ